jgi:iron complex outermembrane receptor protein
MGSARTRSHRTFAPRTAPPLALLATLALAAPARGEEQLQDLSLEQLMSLDVGVSGASRFEQRETEAPASVTVVTAEQIRRFGWRTLADVLRSIRGFYVNYDYTYANLGVRGFGALADDNGRILLLLDGHRVNEPIYDYTPIGSDGWLDLDLVERIEIVRGSSSSLYGSNAFFSVVSVTTRQAGARRGGELRAEVASRRTLEGGAQLAGPLGDHLQVLAGASALDSGGQRDFTYPTGQVVHGQDAERAGRGILKATVTGEALGTLTLEVLGASRRKEVPTDMYGEDLGQPENWTLERRFYTDASWHRAVGERVEVTGRAYLDAYAFEGNGAYSGVTNRDVGAATWAGAEVLTVVRTGRNVLSLGGEARDLFRRHQENHDVSPARSYLDIQSPAWVTGLFAQDELRLGPVRLNGGIRFDHMSDSGSAVSPRVAVIWKATDGTVLKLLYGRAHRAPNAYEAHYTSEGYDANPDLRPERIDSVEAIADQQLPGPARLVLNAYHYDIHGLITQEAAASGNFTFRNTGRVQAWGAEAELEVRRSADLWARLSYAYQRAYEVGSGRLLFNSPQHLAKADATFPIWPDHVLGALEAQLTGRRRTVAGNWVDPAMIVNATVLVPDVVTGLDLRASVGNVFGDRPRDPVSAEFSVPALRREGTTFRATAVYRF